MPGLKSEHENCSRQKHIIILALLFLAVAGSLGWLLFKALYDTEVPFLKSDKRAQWILYPLSFEVLIRAENYVNMTAKFEKDFEISSVPPRVVLYIRAFENFTLRVNNNEVYSNLDGKANWKKLVVADISHHLKAGINKVLVQVHCRYGPPAIWAYSDGLTNNLRTDTTWLVSISGSPPIAAQVADDFSVYVRNFDSIMPLHMFARKSLMLAIFFAISAAAFLIYSKISTTVDARRSTMTRFPAFTPETVLILLICAWIIQFWVNAPRMPLRFGFDAEGHQAYIQQLLSTWRIPLANEGWQAYQGPLFYIISAAAVSVSKLFLPQQYVVYCMKLIPFLCGLGLILVTYYAARIVFPDCKIKQAVSTTFAAIIPMNIYISHYISNEPLCGFLMALSVLMTLHILNSSRRLLLKSCILGVILGLSLLTKYTALVLLPVITIVLLYEFIIERRYGFWKIFSSLAVLSLIVFLIAGWFYLRNWQHFGKFIVGNWDPQLRYAWWQDPGYHTYRHFFQFGKVFLLPYFAGSYSFFDSLYSTFWGDGQIGGMTAYIFRPPWDYQYMSSVYLLAIPATILIIVGMFRAGLKVVGTCSSKWLFILASIVAILFSLVYMELRLARYNQTKAFYGLFAILPISLLFAYGFDLIYEYLKRFRIGPPLLLGWFGVLALSIFMSFHIRPGQDIVFKAVESAKSENFNEAIKYYKLYIDHEPNIGRGYSNLAGVYANQGKFDEAAKYYKKAIELKEDDSGVLLRYSHIILNKPNLSKDDKAQAVQYAQRSCELSGYLDSMMVFNLAEAYNRVENIQDALKMAERAEQLALSANEQNIVQLSRQFIQLYTEQIRNKQAGQKTQSK